MAPEVALEAGLPLEWLSRMAAREANSRRPVYQLHKYWARRPGSLFRMLILAAFLPPGTDLEQAYLSPVDLGGKLVLDPFMGGGTTVVEALRLGCRAVGVDVNPLAWWVTARQVEPVDPAALAAAVAALEARAAPAIRARYGTRCRRCGGQAEMIYAFWVRQAPCPHCGTEADLFSDHRLGPGGRWRHCPACGHVGPAPAGARQPAARQADARQAGAPPCPACGHAAAPAVRRGVLACPACRGRIHRRGAAAGREGPLPARLYALEYQCPGCGDRGYAAPDAADHDRCRRCAAELAGRAGVLPIPRHPIPDGLKTRDLLRHGFRRWDQLFGDRQLLCLGELFAAIAALPPGPVRNTLLATASDCLNANNMLCKYNWAAGKLEPLFGLHAYHIVDQPVEGHVWGAAAGRGSFRRYVEKTLRAKRYLLAPFEAVERVGPRRGGAVDDGDGGEASRNGADAGRNGADTGRNGADAGRNPSDAERNAPDAGRLGLDAHRTAAIVRRNGPIVHRNASESAGMATDAGRHGLDAHGTAAIVRLNRPIVHRNASESAGMATDAGRHGLDAHRTAAIVRRNRPIAHRNASESAGTASDAGERGRLPRPRPRRVAVGPAVAAAVVEEAGALAEGAGNLLLRCGSAERLEWLPDGSVDAVITDPPYLDNVQYGELSAFFHAWLHTVLGGELAPFAAPSPGREQELVVDGGARDRDFFIQGLRRSFAECRRVLRDDGLLVFTFHHRDPAAWAAVLAAVAEAGFVVTAAYPVAAESRSGLHSTAGNIKFDMPLVCRKRQAPPEPVQWEALRQRIAARVQESLAGLAAAGRAAGRPPSPADAASLALGRALALWTAHYPEVYDGPRRQDPAGALAQVADLVRRAAGQAGAPPKE